MSRLPRPTDPGASIADLALELAHLLGLPGYVAVCADLLGGARREEYLDELRFLSGHRLESGSSHLDRTSWHDYWVRTWGARGLLHVWEDGATQAVVAGLTDEHWRPAEMCLKVVARREVAGAGAGAALLADHDLPRVRAQAMRALAVVGDTEHLDAVGERLGDEDEAVRRQATRALESLRRRLDLR